MHDRAGRIPGRVALVTGASSGLGAEFAQQLAAAGFGLVLVARRDDRLQEQAYALRTPGRSVEVLPADLGDRAATERVAERLADPRRPIDVLVNNAGFAVGTPLTAEDAGPHDRAYEVMCRATLVLGGAAARAMVTRRQGTIINVSSLAGLLAMGSYSAAKAWVTSYSQGLSAELRGTGVTTTALLPGWVRTEFHDRPGVGRTGIPRPLWLQPEPVVRQCLRDAARGRTVSVPSVRYRLIGGFLRHAPRAVPRGISAYILARRRNER